MLLIVNNAYAFRFPRAGTLDLSLEIEVLKTLQSRSIVPTPTYGYVDPEGRFAGYAFIDGIELTPSRFAALSPAGQNMLLTEAARFLLELHELPVAAVEWPGLWPRTWTAAQFADRGLAERLPLIARHAAHLAQAIEAFYGLYAHDRPNDLVIVHGDLVTEHILLERQINRLAGIIDFGDVALGDRAQDFLGFWHYGETAAAQIVELYAPDKADPGLLARSRNHFIRYRIDRLFETLRDGGSADVRGDIAELGALLT